jgi:ribose transport system substrate-binding protein
VPITEEFTIMSRSPLLLSLCLCVPLLTGCSGPSASAPGSAPKAGGERVIGVSLLTLENPFFKVIGDTITAEGKKHGYEVVVQSADEDAARQANQVKDFLVRRVSAIVLSPKESRSIVPVVQEANAAGIPVFTVDIPCLEPGVKFVCQVATDNLGGGKEAGRAMIEALGPNGGKIGILHFKTAESCRLRVQGFRQVIEEHNASSAKKIEIVSELDGGGAKAKGSQATQDMLQAHGDLRGIFAINDPSALGARAAIEQAGKTEQVIIIGFDGQPEGKQAIKEGKIYADPIQFPDKMGVQIVDAILKYSRGEDVQPEILIPTSLYRKADGLKDKSLR